MYFPIHFPGIISKLIIKSKYLCLREIVSNAYLIILPRNEMFVEKILSSTKRKISDILNIFNKKGDELSDRCENLTSIPGIGSKNCNNFYEAGYMTPESIISATDEELLTIPGVGISFVKKLRKTLGRV